MNKSRKQKNLSVEQLEFWKWDTNLEYFRNYSLDGVIKSNKKYRKTHENIENESKVNALFCDFPDSSKIACSTATWVVAVFQR